MKSLWKDTKTLVVGVCTVSVITVTILMTSCNTEEVVEQAVINQVNEVKKELDIKVEEVKSNIEEIIPEVPEIPEVNIKETINNAIEGE